MMNAKHRNKKSNSGFSYAKTYIAVVISFLFGFSICATFYATQRTYLGDGHGGSGSVSSINNVFTLDDIDGTTGADEQVRATTSQVSSIIDDNNTGSKQSAVTRGNKAKKQQTHDDILHELDVLSGGYQRSQDHDLKKCPHPLVPFHNQIIRVNQTDTVAGSVDPDLKIPRILHVSMKSRCLPRDLARTMDRWKETLPNYSIFFHDDEAVSRLIDQEWPQFPDLHRAMRCILYKGAMRIDVWRVLILYKYGGVYSDIDNWPTDAFKESTIRSDLSGFFFQDAYTRPSQWFMAVEPHHPLMGLAMNRIILNVMNLGNLRKPQVVLVTGPHAMKSAYMYFLAPTCCNGTIKEQVFQNDVVLDGILDKKVLKTRHKGLIIIKHQYSDIVPYNATLNVTRQERISMDSGVLHWEKTNFYAAKTLRQTLPRVYANCPSYLKAVDTGAIKEIIPF
mmetsp:Transcript_25201/g.37322  ORF Transcript_25201/g.37322 Transcript_25201/m.37322 type:complete len:449 (-) Transcript_25201:168-1514(-)